MKNKKNNNTYSEYNAWLQPKKNFKATPITIRSSAGDFAADELSVGLERLWGELNKGDFTVDLSISEKQEREEFSLSGGSGGFYITGGSEIAVLYGTYKLLEKLSQGYSFEEINETSKPRAEYRIINHWDNMDGSIERGYAGGSVFFVNNDFNYDPKRIKDYARLLASVGINAVAVNNVNVTEISAGLITKPLLGKAAVLAEIFRPFGIRLCFSVSFDSPVIVGGLDTPDPLNDKVKRFWEDTAAEIYKAIPDFLGFVVKADSEFRGGPAAFGRTQADGANTMARALKPYGGVVFWRCFIYNCKQDWRDAETDRPMAAYNTFKPLDGMFDENVILQIKFGPVDFQVREPVSPLFYALDKTNEAIEYQITQEYTGHQIDLYASALQWSEINRTIIRGGKTIADMYGSEIKAVCAVSNIGNDGNWTGNTLAQCNLYSFGRMAWNPDLSAEEIINDWVSLTFDIDEEGKTVIKNMLLSSREIYENYTAPFGIGFMVTPGLHYGPDMEGYEYSKWGTYHRANFEAIGVNRTINGTGYTGQYPSETQRLYDNISTCPEELLLFFHRVRYDFIMKNGKTLLQNIYDLHFKGARDAEKLLSDWDGIENMLPPETYNSVRKRLVLQTENAREWRDRVNTYFYRFTGVADEQGRKVYE